MYTAKPMIPTQERFDPLYRNTNTNISNTDDQLNAKKMMPTYKAGDNIQEDNFPSHFKANKNSRERASPIYTSIIAMRDIISHVKKNSINEYSYTIKQSSPSQYVILLMTVVIHSKIKKVLSVLAKDKIQFYTFADKSEKLKNSILKGIRDFDEYEIIDEI